MKLIYIMTIYVIAFFLFNAFMFVDYCLTMDRILK